MTPELPVVDSISRHESRWRDGSVAGVLLAAGTSSRFGDRNKLLATVEGQPVVRRAGRALADAGLDPLVAVVGYDAARIRESLDDLGFTAVRNPHYGDGQATSVRIGAKAIGDATAAVFGLGDMPWIDPGTVETLVAAYRAGQGTALAPAYEGERGNPVLFDAQYFESLTDLSGDTGGRRILLENDDAALVAVDDPGIRRDVDTPTDLRG